MVPVFEIPVIMIVAANWAIQVPIVKVSDYQNLHLLSAVLMNFE
jgi:hypothetical protein